MLLIRPQPAALECLPDYAGRLADVNGLQSGRDIFQVLEGAGTEASALLGVTAGAAQRTVLAVTSTDVVWRGTHYPLYDFLQTEAPHCPQCLAENGQRPIYWRSRWAVVCAKHRTRLVGECSACGGSPTPLSGTAVRCMCGIDLRRRAPGNFVASADVIEVQQFLDAAFVAGVDANPSMSGHPAWNALSSHGGSTVLQWLLRIMPNVAAPGKGSGLSQLPLRFEDLRNLVPIIQGWPDSLAATLTDAWIRYYDLRRQLRTPEATSLSHRLRGAHAACAKMVGDAAVSATARHIHLNAANICQRARAMEDAIDGVGILLTLTPEEHQSIRNFGNRPETSAVDRPWVPSS